MFVESIIIVVVIIIIITILTIIRIIIYFTVEFQDVSKISLFL